MIECVMNISEGRDLAKVEKIAGTIDLVSSALLLDVSSDADHNRSVITFVAGAETIQEAAFRLIEATVESVSLVGHQGVHPRIGAADVVPLVPMDNTSFDWCAGIARRLAARVATVLRLPVYLYGEAALRSQRRNLAEIRKGGLERLSRVIVENPDWAPDYGPKRLHPTAGACVIGVRKFLIAYNIFLESSKVEPARSIARQIRERDGGLPAVKALGFLLKSRRQAQVSVNLLDFQTTSLETLFGRVVHLAGQLGIGVSSSEIVGLIPNASYSSGLEHRLKIENWRPDLILEKRIEAVAGGARS